MSTKRKIEIFSASCPVCEEAIDQVKKFACSSCEIIIRDIQDSKNLERARAFGIRSIPAVVFDGKLADCCGHGIDKDTLIQAGLGEI